MRAVPSPRSLLTSARRRPAVRRLLVLAVLILAYQGWLGIQSVGKVDAGVGTAADRSGRFPVDVVLEFRPERYHILRLQKHGRIAGTNGTTVHLRGVSAAGVDAIAREYWVESVVPPG